MPTLLVFGARNLGRVLARELSEQGWRVAAVARTESTIEQLREQGVHVALLSVDAIIESEKTKGWLEDAPAEKSASMEDVVRAIGYLHEQSPRAWTHELQLTPALERWVP